MEHLSGLIVKIAERCNLNCTYCYMYNHVDQTYRDRPRFMSEEVFARLVNRIAVHLSTAPLPRRMKMVFHGGEPMLIDVSRLRRMLSLARRELNGAIAFSIQTNGTLITKEWIDLIREYKVSVGISIDGDEATHNRFRVFQNGRGSHDAVVSGINKLRAAGIAPYGLCVIAPGANGLAAYRYIRKLGFSAFDFLFPDQSHDSPKLYSGPSPTPVADYLIPVFDEWFAGDDAGIRIRVFEALLRTIRGGSARLEGFGRRPTNYLVIDTDGTMHGNDALKVCASDLSFTGLNIIEHGFADLSAGSNLIYQLTCEGLPTASTCMTCPEVAVCGGGAAPTRYSKRNGFNNPSVWCADLRKLITHIRQSLPESWAVVPAQHPAIVAPQPIPASIPWRLMS